VQESFNRLSGLKPSIKSTQNINPMKSCMKVPQLTNEQIEERYKVCVSEAIALGVKPPVPAQSEGEMNVRAHRYHISCLESQRHLIGENLFPYLFHSICLFVPFFSALLSVCLSVRLSVVFLYLFSSVLTCACHLLFLPFSRSLSILSPDYSSVCTSFSLTISSVFVHCRFLDFFHYPILFS
jgi:hypothetical protein